MDKRLIPVRDAGGGPGKKRLHFHVLNETQVEMFKKTLEPTPLETLNIEQERRQINTLITYIDLKVNVAREDFPSVNADIILNFQPYQATQAWQKFIADVSKAIGLEFIDCIVDRKDGSPVHRAMRLRNGGNYFARQGESSSILEILVTSEPPVQYIWDVTKDIAKVKEELDEGFKDQEKITTRVKELINRPKHRDEEKSVTDAILQAEHPLDIVDAMDELVHSALVEKQIVNEEKQLELNSKVIPSDTRNKILTQKDVDKQKNPKLWHFDTSVDIVSLHRLALEHLNRMALIPKPVIEKQKNDDSDSDDDDDDDEEEEILSNAEIIVTDCLNFILETLENFRYETDVNVIGLRCIADLIPHLGTERTKVMEALLNNIQIYAPERPDFRGPRIVPRIQPTFKPIVEEEELPVEQKPREKKKKPIDDDEDSEEEEKREKARIAWELEFKRQQEEEAKQRAEEEKRSMKPLRFVPKKRWSGMKGDLLKPPEKKPENPFLKIKKVTKEEKVKAAPVVRSRKKLLVAMKSLPIVPGILFRGFPNLMKRNMILVQSFATLFKLIDFSFPNRDTAFKLKLHEEIAEIGQVCQSMPQVLEYILWIINAMYRDGFTMGGEDANDINSVIASMQVTETNDETHNNIDNDNQSVDPLTGKVIEALSSLSGVTVTMEDIKTNTPRVNRGDPNRHYEEEPEFWDRPQDFYMQGDSNSNVTGKNLDMSPLPMKVPDGANDRYTTIPGDDVLITLGMISHHLDLDESDRGLAHKWLTLWDDCSPHFKKMVQKGINLIDL